MTDCELLGHVAAIQEAQHVRPPDPVVIEYRGAVVGEIAHCVTPGEAGSRPITQVDGNAIHRVELALRQREISSG